MKKQKKKHNIFAILIGVIFLILIICLAIIAAIILGAVLLVCTLVAYVTHQTSNVVRRKGNTLYVPVVNLYNETTQQRITFLGCIHIGNNEYYRTLEHFIAQHPKATVLCEGKKESFTDPDKIAKHPHTLLAGVMGMVAQFTMHYQDHWEYNDHEKKLNQLSRIMSILQKKDSDGKTFEEKLRKMKEKDRKIVGKILSWFIMNMTFFSLIGKLRKKTWRQRVMQHVILNVRNEHAIKQVDQRKDAHIILLWGAAHYPGMKKLLGHRGFEQTDRNWIPAFTRQ